MYLLILQEDTHMKKEKTEKIWATWHQEARD